MNILVVDDEPLIRSLVKRVLEPEGYNVLLAESTIIALQVAEDLSGHIHLALIDYTLEGQTCEELVRRLWQLNPSIHVVISSGDEDAMKKLQSDLSKRVLTLGKPYSTDDLLLCVETVQSQRTSG